MDWKTSMDAGYLLPTFNSAGVTQKEEVFRLKHLSDLKRWGCESLLATDKYLKDKFGLTFEHSGSHLTVF